MQDEIEKGPLGGGMGTGPSCTGVTPAAIKSWFAPLGRDLDADFEPCACKRVHACLRVLARLKATPAPTGAAPKSGPAIPAVRQPGAVPSPPSTGPTGKKDVWRWSLLISEV